MKKAANGAGSIGKKVVTRDGVDYTYWRVRYCEGRDATGKQKRREKTFSTQGEAAKFLRSVTSDLDRGIYVAPTKMTVAQWLDIWQDAYLVRTKRTTDSTYDSLIKHHIRPDLGDLKLEELTTATVQKFCNSLTRKKCLSAKTARNIMGLLHQILQRAAIDRIIPFNVADNVVLPRAERKEIVPLNEEQTRAFLAELAGDSLEDVILTTLLTGAREGEIIALQWNCIDFKTGTIKLDKQLQQARDGKREWYYSTLKSGKARTIQPAPLVMDLLKAHRVKQKEQQLKAGPLWSNPDGLVFTTPTGDHLTGNNCYCHVKRIAAKIGRPDLRFHDLRHTFAVSSLRAGDDLKTLQNNLGHSTASFTMQVYAHVTDDMRAASSARLDNYFRSVIGG